jgi:hypothetical protein
VPLLHDHCGAPCDLTCVEPVTVEGDLAVLLVVHVEVVLLLNPVVRHDGQYRNMPLTCGNTSV